MREGDVLTAAVLNLPLALSDGNQTTLAQQIALKHWLILYFYPKDNTPGCTTEGLEFNARLPEFARLNAHVLGISRDSVKSHAHFCRKQGFNFPLISDSDEALCNAFEVIKPKNMYGKLVQGIERSTFLIEPEKGTVLMQWRKVKVPGHAQAVLEALKAHLGLGE